MTIVTNPVFATMLTSFVVLAAPAVAADAPSDDTLATSQGDAAIHAFHHAALSIKWNGITIVADPAPMMGGGGGGQSAADAATEFKSAGTPDIILVTHEHPDHYNPDVLAAIVGDKTMLVVPKDVADKLSDALKGKAKVMNNGDTATVAGVSISAVPAYNTTPDRQKYHPQGRDNGYVLTLGDKHVYIAGDTEDTPEMRALTGIDVAFLPMNLPFTMDVGHAADVVKAFKPKVVYPYHYGQSDVNDFKAEVGDAADVRLLKWY